MGNMILATLLLLLLPTGEAFNGAVRAFDLVSVSKMEFRARTFRETIVKEIRVCRLIIDRCKQGKAEWSHVTPCLRLQSEERLS